MAITITQENKAKWQKAIDKARTVKPLVRVLGYGSFQVSGSRNYTVVWSAPKGGEVRADCNCPASLSGKVCYHLPATAALFKQQVAARQAERVCCECGDLTNNPPAHADTELCLYCIECAKLSKDEADLFG